MVLTLMCCVDLWFPPPQPLRHRMFLLKQLNLGFICQLQICRNALISRQWLPLWWSPINRIPFSCFTGRRFINRDVNKSLSLQLTLFFSILKIALCCAKGVIFTESPCLGRVAKVLHQSVLLWTDEH